MSGATALIVCGYDLDTDLRAYVADVIRATQHEQPDLLILAGGRTSPYTTDSEALVMSHAYAELQPERAVVLDEDSVSSLENLLHAKRLAEANDVPIERFVVVGDTAHRRKLSILARLVIGRNASVIAVPRPTAIITHVLEPLSTFFEAIGAVVPATRRVVRSGALLFKMMRYGAFFTSVSQ
jgi:uncharacterized SAM-binding protein YcdF (DUF218 family)